MAESTREEKGTAGTVTTTRVIKAAVRRRLAGALPKNAGVAHDLSSERLRSADVKCEEDVTFASLHLSEAVAAGVAAAGFLRPSPIQLRAIPLGRCGVDMVAQSKSGTGKTCAFCVITLEAVWDAGRGTHAMVLSPTRELALQSLGVLRAVGSKTAVTAAGFVGGVDLKADAGGAAALPSVAVGTPGRMQQLVVGGHLPPGAVRLLVLDEADRLLGMDGLREQTLALVQLLPPRKQVLAFSATFSRRALAELGRVLRDPVHVRIDPASPSLDGVSQYCRVLPAAPLPTLNASKERELLQLLGALAFRQCTVFCNLRSKAAKLAAALLLAGIPSVVLTGEMPQPDRAAAMAKFRDFKARVLVTTDVTARGVDVERVNLVVNFDAPSESATYLHRVGRTGRFGTRGVAVTYLSEPERRGFDALLASCGATVAPLPPTIDSALYDFPLPPEDAKRIQRMEELATQQQETATRQEQPVAEPARPPARPPAPRPSGSGVRSRPPADAWYREQFLAKQRRAYAFYSM